MNTSLRISVRALVEHSLRAGDLNLESWGAFSPVDAIRAHQRLQSSRGADYEKEVRLVHVVESSGFTLTIGGRIDGVLQTTGGAVVEEIKTTTGQLDSVASREDPTHWGQLKVYAFIYAAQNDLDELTGRLTYYQLDTGETRELDRRLERETLRHWFDGLIASYIAWARRIHAWHEERDRSIDEIGFPFPEYRPGQREMAVQTYRAIEEERRLLIRAPTGIGKTLATIFPSIKALGEGIVEKVFYLTARTTGRALAEQALGELRAGGLALKSVTLTAKDRICFNPDKACNGDECAFAKGFYDRISSAMDELFQRDGFDRQSIEEVAEQHQVCPFELSLELSTCADVIVADYNYLFDPRTHLRRFFADEGGDYVFLVDEAHNLLDRARDLYSAELRKPDVLAARRLIDKDRHRTLYRSLTSVNRALVEIHKTLGENKTSDGHPPERLYPPLKHFRDAAESWLQSGVERGTPMHHGLLELYYDVSRFLATADRFDERYVTCYEVTRERELRVKLFCTDPAPELSESFDKGRASILFSATLTPMSYFRETLGCGEEAASYVLPSPFPRDHLRVLVHDRIATTYRRRGETRDALASILCTFVDERAGNYLVFFPSYEYLNAVHAAAAFDDAEVLVQRPDMDERERARFLERFAVEPDRTLVGFAVLGGFFGEGIDLVGERLTGAAVVGVGLPGLSPERDRIRERFDRAGADGFKFAYAFPGMNRVLQAAGRVIRSEHDRGAVLLIDERFSRDLYRRLLPSEWAPVTVASPSALREELRAFWV